MPLLVVAHHPQPLVVSGLAAVNTAPWLLFALPVGVLVDRHDRRRIILLSNVVRGAALLAAVAAFAAGSSLAVLYALAFVLGIAETFAETAAPAMLPSIVEPESLERANGRLFVPQIIFNEMAGPPIAGLLVGVGAVLALATDGTFYALAAVLLLGLARPRLARADATRQSRSIRYDITSGLRFVLAHPAMARTLTASTLYGLTYSATFSLLVLFTYKNLHLNATGYGLLLTVGSVGSLGGSFLAERLAGKLPVAVLAKWSLVFSGVAYIALGMSRTAIFAGAAILCNGIFMMCWNIPVMSLRQRLTPAEFRGRVMSVSRLCSWGSMPIGAAVGGLLARALSVSAIFVGSGCALIVGSLLLLGPLRREMLTEERLQ